MVRADYDPRYFRRFLIIGLGCVAYSAWCVYDLQVKYPHEMERATAYWTPVEGRPGEYIAMEREPWRTLVRENGWSVSQPDMPTKIKHSISFQYFQLVVCVLIGIPALLKWALAKGSWVEGDATHLQTSWGPGLDYNTITHIDKTKWSRKGITRIHYEDAGQPRVFVFDDFKFLRAPMGQILRHIESTLADDQIHGGTREPEPDSAEAAPEPAPESAAGTAGHDV